MWSHQTTREMAAALLLVTRAAAREVVDRRKYVESPEHVFDVIDLGVFESRDGTVRGSTFQDSLSSSITTQNCASIVTGSHILWKIYIRVQYIRDIFKTSALHT